MIYCDLVNHRLVSDAETKHEMARRMPYRRWEMCIRDRGKLLHFIPGKSVAERRLNPENAFCRGNSQFPRDFFCGRRLRRLRVKSPAPASRFQGCLLYTSSSALPFLLLAAG